MYTAIVTRCVCVDDTPVAFFCEAHKRDDPENLCLPRDWKLCDIILWLHTRKHIPNLTTFL